MHGRLVRGVVRLVLSAAVVVACASRPPPAATPPVGPADPQVVPAVSSWGGGTPGGGAPNAGAPNAGAPNAGAPNAGAPNAGAPNAGAPNAGAPNAGAPNAGAPNAGAPNAGAPNAGAPNAGAPNAGAPNAGAPNAGAPNAGAPNAGAPNAGAPNAGAPNAGAPNAGAPNAGAPNAGAPNPVEPNENLPARGVPTSISLVITDGTGQDFVHALYKPGSVLRLGANIRDGYGSSTAGTPNTPCTPVYSLEDNIAPDGSPRASLAGNTVTFLRDGPFTVRVHCQENPSISSRANEAPYNFETGSGTFAKEKVPVETPKAGLGPRGRVVAVVVLIGLGAVLVYQVKKLIDLSAEDPGGGGSCPTESEIGGCGTTACIPSTCECPGNFIQTGIDNGTRCGSPAGQKLCSCPARASASTRSRSNAIHTVHEFVAWGFANQHAQIADTRVRGPNTTTPTSRNTGAAGPRAQLGERAPVGQPPRPLTPNQATTRVTAADRNVPRVGRNIAPVPAQAIVAASATRMITASIASLKVIAPTTAPRRYDARSTARAGSSPSDLDVRSIALEAAFTAYAFVRAARGTAPGHGIEVIPWGETQAAGLTVMGRF